ncbi:MAG TPA: crossover junction endodeoxyribonuclease RuvC [Candidatus Woesebacteria bacterium]|jgi:crossover junction endodeoxyribonuclease RuvC|nr:crossover junction endodeoxyribonuclease RuvC [Candidatus Shapirobacteria bacterium]HOG37797.1 crossover junction endodeoxyribonuclease RuvC [Candidatus Woesebacteria bacterium]HOR02317.1 crossover junction endodeoxyribonuclease RuvC [Candidatus Woesebacteria bacterium]
MILGIDPGLANTGWAVLDLRSQMSDVSLSNSSNSSSLSSSSGCKVKRFKNKTLIDQEGLVSEFELVACGCLRTKIGEESAKRLGKIYRELERLIKKYKVEAIALESLFFAKNAKSALKVAEAIGVIKVCGQKNGVEVVEFTPLQVKTALVGYGRAEKEQVEIMVRNFLGLEENISPSHASDAVAVGLTYLFTNRDLVV